MNIPNTLTLIRIALIPVFVVVFYLPVDWSHLGAALVFTLAAITDWLDGYLARRLGQTSALGAFLDPVADKLMVAVVLVLLLQRCPRPSSSAGRSRSPPCASGWPSSAHASGWRFPPSERSRQAPKCWR